MPKGPKKKEPPFRGIGREKLWRLGDPETDLPISDEDYLQAVRTMVANIPEGDKIPVDDTGLPDEGRAIELFLTLGGDDVDDESFFVFMGADAQWLTFPFAIEKIVMWQEQLFSPDRDESYKAQENLKRIGRVLAFKGWDKDGVDARTVADRRKQVLNVLREKGVKDVQNAGHKKMLLKEVFGTEVIDRIGNLPPLNWQLADAITGALLGLSASTVKKRRTEAKQNK